MAFDIRTAFLSEKDAAFVYRRWPELEKAPDHYCPTCDQKGTFFWKDEEHQCECGYQTQLAKHYTLAGIGRGYQRMDYEDYQSDSAALEAARRYVETHVESVKRGVGLFFTGNIGSGKTLLVNLTLKELVKLGYRCWNTTFASMIEHFGGATWITYEDREGYYQRVTESQVLLLDEVSKKFRQNNKLSETTFDNVLRTRVQDNRPTFLTTNLGFAEIEVGYGGEVLSLLEETSIFRQFNGADFRPQAKRRAMGEIEAGLVRPLA